ncbi:MAG: tyrosine--tRNA ligase [Bacteroidia bacterium]|nr:MAG: tyrosine--tRNA ligase [Bacteroidia bacterium]
MAVQNFVEELRWRGMLQDIMPGTEEFMQQGMVTAYVGFDPTADSLHIGHLVSVMILRHLQRCGHRPVVLLGGATGMIGDPSGKSQERNLLTVEKIEENIAGIRAQFERLIDFNSDAPNGALLLNNYEWMSQFSFLDFIRDIGKHITVNYMMAKDSVKRRLNPEEGGTGLSFTEFTYQLIQGTDFLHMHRHYGVSMQMGGSDQWGNMTTGVELIRRMDGTEAYCLTCPLIKKADGRKFGKTEQGNIWLDRRLTSPYRFYQFWLNTSDEDAGRYIRIFTMLGRGEIEAMEREHAEAPHKRLLQGVLAREVTVMVHGQEEYDRAVEASGILFGKDTHDALLRLDEETFLSVFDGVPTMGVSAETLRGGVPLVDLLTDLTQIFPSKGELRRAVKGGGLSLNKVKVSEAERTVGMDDTLQGKYILVQKGKKDYYIITVG